MKEEKSSKVPKKFVDCRLCKNSEIIRELRYPGINGLGCNGKDVPVVIKDFKRVCSCYEFEKKKCAKYLDTNWYKNYRLEQEQLHRTNSNYNLDDLL